MEKKEERRGTLRSAEEYFLRLYLLERKRASERQHEWVEGQREREKQKTH